MVETTFDTDDSIEQPDEITVPRDELVDAIQRDALSVANYEALVYKETGEMKEIVTSDHHGNKNTISISVDRFVDSHHTDLTAPDVPDPDDDEWKHFKQAWSDAMELADEVTIAYCTPIEATVPVTYE